MTLLHDFGEYLTDAKLVQGLAVDLFTDFIPDDPDNLIVISEYSGSPVVSYERQAANRSVQVRVRDTSPTNCKNRIWEIFKLLNKQGKQQLTDKRWVVCEMRQTPFKIEVDDKERTHYVFNMGVTTII